MFEEIEIWRTLSVITGFLLLIHIVLSTVSYKYFSFFLELPPSGREANKKGSKNEKSYRYALSIGVIFVGTALILWGFRLENDANAALAMIFVPIILGALMIAYAYKKGDLP